MIRAALAALILALTSAAVQAECRLALALGLDVSGSVDAREYRLQMEGLAEALADEDVGRALFAAPGFWVSLAVFEWSSSSYQSIILDWTDISDETIRADMVAALRAHSRGPAPQATGLGAAMEFGTGLLRTRSDCWDRTLDLSGDGRNNDWPVPWRLRQAGQLGDFRINGLAIAPRREGRNLTGPGPGAAELKAYFEARVIHGPDAFVETALGFEDYGRAMKRKLLREIASFPLGRFGPDAPVVRLARQ